MLLRPTFFLFLILPLTSYKVNRFVRYQRNWAGLEPERMGEEIEALFKRYRFDDLSFQGPEKSQVGEYLHEPHNGQILQSSNQLDALGFHPRPAHS